MAFGDIGGTVTELVITCQLPASGTVNVARGDALKLSGAYIVNNDTDAEDVVFGQALANSDQNGAAIPVKVRGVCIFGYTDSAPAVNGTQGIVASATNGKVKAPASGNGRGINVKVDTAASQVHVLL
ncbi:MAG: hypothetical protein HY706_03210 [Candidatus Hydrogenedentes bacterium]|nr:hypothetical protein [Candidatus Hydrogenedentota bacterium]